MISYKSVKLPLRAVEQQLKQGLPELLFFHLTDIVLHPLT